MIIVIRIILRLKREVNVVLIALIFFNGLKRYVGLIRLYWSFERGIRIGLGLERYNG
jgi:predicted CDP-diglyceride synthetase/phosphatidate cytidylyltransferase